MNSDKTHAEPGRDVPDTYRIVRGGRSAAHAPDIRTVDSRELFGGATEIGIMHQGALYRLKITRQGKLILNK